MTGESAFLQHAKISFDASFKFRQQIMHLAQEIRLDQHILAWLTVTNTLAYYVTD
jgi:hypothetical protein